MDIQALRDENDTLRERIRQLEEELGFVHKTPSIFGLTPSEGKFFNALTKRPQVTRSAAMSVLYGNDYSIDPRIADVLICKMRKKLRPYGINIITIWGVGWKMTDLDKTKVAELA